MAKIRCIGVLTSGGDAPGMNAAIRAVTRSAIFNGFKVKAIYRGYEGLMNGEVKTFTTEDVSGIIQTGGTILRTARSAEFQTPKGRKRAYDTLRKEGCWRKNMTSPVSVFLVQSTTISTEQTILLVTTRRSTRLWTAWIRSATRPTPTNVSSSSK